MGTRLLGLSPFLWGALCLIVAGVFCFAVPQEAAGAVGARYYLLRWGHALVWLLLALFCFARGLRLDGPIGMLGLLAGLLYAGFLATLLIR